MILSLFVFENILELLWIQRLWRIDTLVSAKSEIDLQSVRWMKARFTNQHNGCWLLRMVGAGNDEKSIIGQVKNNRTRTVTHSYPYRFTHFKNRFPHDSHSHDQSLKTKIHIQTLFF
jgi:hypothetical protein